MRVFKPFRCDAEIAAIGNGLLNLTWPKSAWTHAAHFAATVWLISCRGDIDLAVEMPNFIRNYNAATGGANTDTEGYHETITQASIRATRDFLLRHPACSLYLACNELMASPLGEPEWLLAYWSRDRLFSAIARRSWVDPDLQPLPF
jgi:hypothetical protein